VYDARPVRRQPNAIRNLTTHHIDIDIDDDDDDDDDGRRDEEREEAF
jgi:hypothetical protein